MSNKTSDKNVANIEDDVKIVKEFIDYAQGVIDDMEYERPVDVTVYQKDLTSMKHILAEREQMLKERDVANDSVIAHKFAVMQQQINEKDKRIQELEEVIETKQKIIIMASEVIENSIQKQVVVDVINENGFEVYTREYGNVEVVSIDVLQELLEGEVGRRLGE